MPTVSVMTMVFGRALEEGAWSDTEMLRAVETAGFDGIEVPSSRLLNDRARLEAYRDYLADSRLRVTCVDAICNLVAPDEAARKAGMDALRAGIEVAAALRAPRVLAAGSRLSQGVSPEDGRRMIADGLAALMPEAEAVGVALAIEDFGVEPSLQCSRADCLEVLDAVPGLEFVFDTGNFYFCGEDPLDNFQPLLRHTRHIHLKDWVKSDRPVIADVSGADLGTGLIPNEGLVRRFLHRGIDSFSLEVNGPGDPFEAARRDLAAIVEWLPERRRE